jgi:malonyl CoA-acyl carrier protein transacylase
MVQNQIQILLTAAIRDAALQVSENLGVQRLIDNVTSYPAKIREQQAVVSGCRRALDDAKAEVEQAKAILFAMVASETENGKARYSNKEAREAEVAVRMNRDSMYIEARNHYRSAEEDYNAAQFDLQGLDNEFKAHVKAADLVSAQLNLLAGSGQ